MKLWHVFVIGGLIGIIPTITLGYTILHWQWWAIGIPLNILNVILHDRTQS